jgi:hypothetical protein
MPRNKDLKRLVRARMNKTGEAYTSARAHIITKSRSRTGPRAGAIAAAPPSFASPPTPKDYPTLAGMSDASLKAKTGCAWERWVKALDRLGAEQMSHGDIAELVHKKYKVDGWWSQTVTVGYERIKGLRARGQRRNGTYEATKSRTFNVPVATLFDAWADGGVRKRWMNGGSVKVRTATAPKSMRLDWNEGGIIAVGFSSKGASKSSVAVAHTKLPSKAEADRIKRYWSERLNTLGEVLAAS